jgi:hypothetical protein
VKGQAFVPSNFRQMSDNRPHAGRLILLTSTHHGQADDSKTTRRLDSLARRKQAWQSFHDEFLKYGGPPIPLVRAAMLGGAKGSLFQ